MSIIVATDEKINAEIDLGMQLANIRQQKGYSAEYVASKLHLRVRIIELLESGDFQLLPEPVFVMGYLRAYAKLLGISPEPLLAVFSARQTVEKKTERTLWQSKRQSHKAENFVRWFTIVFALGVLIAIGIWWHKNNEPTPSEIAVSQAGADFSLEQDSNSEVKLTDLSKMQALLNPSTQMTPLEKEGG